ncbi:DEAD/DEAH box helicase [Paenibacillus chondroitinus]|uniref:DEAD/DEAH box helicase n=1 Tax=Paenibacillus chondroitinus TaxID=59842 RepID=A0ABU6DDD3_9BACL|nr:MULTISPECIES: DEAD/DEAH box helicase [Paenibacillus]MCY9657479.1 DEAD/DEAH box helicase [Paenibacillus anseongense]MEB4794901.1 DEAD/DEAH box helicase [Paenibacillus chondroitinus]
MISLSQVHIRVQKLPTGSFAFYGETEQANEVPGYALRKLLFAWHEGSFYGTQLESIRTGYGEALVLTPYMALDYLANPGTLLHGKLSWDADVLLMKKGAALFSEALTAGWYMPSFRHWLQGGMGWKPQLPGAKLGELEHLYKGTQDEDFWHDWFHAAALEMMKEAPDSEIGKEWRRLSEGNALLREGPSAETSWMQEEDWLLAIGWKQDGKPYRICVQLVEPYAETYVDGTTTAKDNGADWRLRFIAQDRQDTNHFVEFSTAGTILVGRVPAAWQDGIDASIQDQTNRVLRILPQLESEFQKGKIVEQLSDDQAWEFLTESSLLLAAAGISVFLPSWWGELSRARPQLRAKVRSSVGTSRRPMFGMDHIIQFDWRVALGGVDLSEEEFHQIAEQKKRLIYIRGRWVQLNPADLEQMKAAMRQREKRKGFSLRDVLEMQLTDEPSQQVSSTGEQKDEFKVHFELNSSLRNLLRKLNQRESLPFVQIDGLEADLRPYQEEGVSWLLFLRGIGLGGCLADDMGLGKTVQFIAYLLAVKGAAEQLTGRIPSQSQSKGQAQRKDQSHSQSNGQTELQAIADTVPSLLICPTSVLGNWQKELERFAPSLNIHLHYGAQRAKGEAFEASVAGADLVITSYNIALLDEEELASITWNTLCLDEAQNIKNAYTKQSQAIRGLNARHRIALTGTPLENRLTELWSIFDFINPGYLGTLRHFNHHYVGPIEKSTDGAPGLTSRVQRLIRPFLLRRVKKDPAIQLSLPEKVESKAYVALTPEQGALYENVVQTLMERIDSLSVMEKKGLILASLTKLKQICDHPSLFLKEGDRAGAGVAPGRGVRSAKLERLLEMIDELRSDGGGCLIFTQFVEMGHLLQRVIAQERGEPVQFLHGAVAKAKRDEMIARFQDDALPEAERCRIFILSLKAGGTGLNLTAANHVFHYDRWWNPAVENQATDRAFRIGQSRDVQVHKFITLGTLEERIDEMIERKKGLSDQIVGTGESWVTEMSTSELRELFALRREWVEK